MADIFNMLDTWNASGTVFTGIKLNVTDTASAAGSLLMDLQVGGVSQFKVAKNGDLTGRKFISSFWVEVGSSVIVRGEGVYVGSAAEFGFGSFPNPQSGPADVVLRRDAANTLAQRNGLNAQAFNLYNTYDNSLNYERGFMRFVSNVLQIGTDRLGTGSTRSLVLQTNGATRLTIGPTGTPEFTLAGALYINGQVGIAPVSTGVMRLVNYNADGFSTLQLGLATTGFPALKVSTSTLQVRLGNDSAFTNIQGKLTTEANAVSETITATHTITLYDAAGTAYKVPCVAV